MNGFHVQDQFPQVQTHTWKSAVSTITCMSLILSLCSAPGCAMTRRVWSGVHSATCGEPDSQCSCTCGDCVTDAHSINDAGHHRRHSHSSRSFFPVTPLPPEGSGPIEQENQSQTITMNGIQGIWTPTPAPLTPRLAEQHSAFADNSSLPWSDADAVTTSPRAMTCSPQAAQQNQSQLEQTPPHETQRKDELQEYRTQIQILTEQLLQMKSAQDSIKVSQDSMQQQHEREMLEIKLQQATADRDRLQREHELEQQLEKQRQRELETIDSLSEIIDGVVPAPAVPSAAMAPAQRRTSQSRQVRSVTSQNLPSVDEGT